MTIQQVIDYVGDIKPHTFSNDTLIGWINECEGAIQTEILCITEDEVITYTTEQLDEKLIVKPPHNKIYGLYLIAMIDFAHGEYSKYENTMTLYNSAMSEFAKWFVRTHSKVSPKVFGYYMSGYDLAVKHGFLGSEADWLASLKGDKGEPFVYADFTAAQLEALRGPQGIQGKQGIQGERGEPFLYEDFTIEQLEALRGPRGIQGEKGDKGDKGEPFVYSDFTVKQLEALQGPQGIQGEQGPQGEKGDKGDAGYTPQRGIDYWTPEDVSEIESDANEASMLYINKKLSALPAVILKSIDGDKVYKITINDEGDLMAEEISQSEVYMYEESLILNSTELTAELEGDTLTITTPDESFI